MFHFSAIIKYNYNVNTSNYYQNRQLHFFEVGTMCSLYCAQFLYRVQYEHWAQYNGHPVVMYQALRELKS